MPFTPDALLPAPPSGVAAFNKFGNQLGANGSWENAIFESGGRQYMAFFWNSNFPAVGGGENEIHKILIYGDGGVGVWNYLDDAHSPIILNNVTLSGVGPEQSASFTAVKVGTLLYCFYFTANSPVDGHGMLTVQTFDFTTEAWGLPNVSGLPDVAGTLDVLDSAPDLLAFQDGSSGDLLIFANNYGLLCTDANSYTRPAFATLIPGSLTWSSSWFPMGGGASDLAHYYSVAGGYTAGRINIVMDSLTPPPNPRLHQGYYQAVFTGGTLSFVQTIPILNSTTGLVGSISPISRMLITLSELIVPWGLLSSTLPVEIHALRAPIPTGVALPSWTDETVHTLSVGFFGAYVAICDRSRLFVASTLVDFASTPPVTLNFDQSAGGGTWTQNVSPSPSVYITLPGTGGDAAVSRTVTYSFAGATNSGFTSSYQEQGIHPLLQVSTCGTSTRRNVFLPRFVRGPMPQ